MRRYHYMPTRIETEPEPLLGRHLPTPTPSFSFVRNQTRVPFPYIHLRQIHLRQLSDINQGLRDTCSLSGITDNI